MSLPTGEQARRMPFNSPMISFAEYSTTSSSPTSRNGAGNRLEKAKKERIKGGQGIGSGIPSLNLITNFSAAETTLSKESKPTIQERRKHSKKPSEASATPNPQSALSTSDGTLLIGICLQPGQYEDRKSITPEIVITPATMLQDPWKAEKNWRPRSSMYSQATKVSRVKANVVDIPPIPRLPGQDDIAEGVRPLSDMTWQTDFEEDAEREEICRRYSGDSQLGIVRNISVRTTRRASDGWWNTLVSPIFGPRITFTKQTVRPLPNQVHRNEEQQVQSLDVLLPPDGKKNARRSSIWTDLDRLDAQRQTLAFFDDSPTDLKHSIKSINEKELTPEVVQESGFGLASEYYEASWHDMYSSIPFFQCTGHDCGLKVAYRHGNTIGGPDAVYELDGLTGKNLAVLSAQSTVAKVFSKGRQSISKGPANAKSDRIDRGGPAHLIRSRRDSEGTEIDDEPDTRSVYHEANSKSSSCNESPMLEFQKPFKDYAIPSTPKSGAKKNMEKLDRSPIETPAKSLRIMGLDKGYLTPERATANEPRSGRQFEPTPSPQRKNRNVLRKAPPTTDLEDPFRDPVNPVSPAALTPVLREEFIRNRAIPLEAQRSQTNSASQSMMESSSIQHDPLNISAPRRAPLPPRTRSAESPYQVASVEPNPAQRVPMYGMPGMRPVHHELSSSSATSLSMNDKMVIEDSGRAKYVPFDFAPPPTQPFDTKTKDKSENTKVKKISVCMFFACSRRDSKPPTKKRKRWYFVIGSALLALVIIVVVLVLTLTMHRSDASVQSHMFNITGFPPIPTGISTIAQPNAAIEESRCVAPNTLWSCALPKEEQASIAPNAPNQPNFRLEIRFQNGSSSLNASNTINSRSVKKETVTSSFVKRRFLSTRDTFTSSLFNPSPAPPDQEEQIFLGKTTDNNTAPFQGEATPFFISFLSPTPIDSKQALASRDDTNPFPNVTAAIPPPSVNSDGTAAAANLVPFPTAQPLMLYNRGRSDEHYGFYTFFDRSIFLKSTDILNSTGPDIPDNGDGGSTRSAADARCTWTQTRFLVQIWTDTGNAFRLLNSSSSAAALTPSSTSSSPSPSSSSSATNFVQPGSFPYPVSITLDRHGGDNKAKMVYCYGMDIESRIVSTQKQVHLENRRAGGPGLINSGGSLFGGPVNVSFADGGPGGIDGGFGGCRCYWRNWVQV